MTKKVFAKLVGRSDLLRRATKFDKTTSLVVVVVLILVGTVIIFRGRAAGPFASIQPEQGNFAAGACPIPDANASGGSFAQFGGCPAGDLALPRIPWEGGSAYWKKFAKADAAGWDDPSFFPIAVFYGKPDTGHVNSLKDVGINILAPVERDGRPLSIITDVPGMYAMPGSSEVSAAEAGNNPGIIGWFISDECEMEITNCPGYRPGDDGEQRAFDLQKAEVDRVKAFNDGRFVHANYGNGILRTFVAPTLMPQFVQILDSASADKYTYTSPHVTGIIDGWHDAPDWPNGVPVPRAYSYGWQTDQMRRFQNPSSPRPIWVFIESAMPKLTEDGAREITPQEMEGAIWSALIHEARGVYYFQHNGERPTKCTAVYSIVECPAVHAAVKATNAKVKSLASVLNTQSYYNKTRVVNGFTYHYYGFDNGTDTMLKTYNGSAYIFAGLGMRCNNETCTSGTVDQPGSKTFTLPVGVNGTTVEVVGENRTLPVNNRSFTDNFAAEYSHHVYRIAL
jgi:hypothetical protein